MVSKYQAGSQAYLIESNRIIREVTVVSCRSDFYIVRFAGNSGNGGIQVTGECEKHPWNMDKALLEQIWAEALTLYN